MVATCLLALGVASCGKSEPVYSGISLMGQNYLPYNLSRFTIIDAYGNKAGAGGDSMPGGGAGSLSCCYRLKGTEFTVKWDYYDADQWHKGDEQMFHAEAKVTMPPSTDPSGRNILDVHFFPDRHIEFQFPGRLSDPSRVPVADVIGWLFLNYPEQLDQRYDERDDQQSRRIARLIASAWLKYGLTDVEDMKRYAYFALLVNRRFDAHPEVQTLLQSTKATPGAFAKAIDALPASVINGLKKDRFTSVAVPAIPDGYLPPPRVPEREDDHA
jgi:hypothetical protein